MQDFLSKATLFNNLSQEEAECFLHCLNAKKVTLKRGEILFNYGDSVDKVVLVKKGILNVVFTDYFGARTILSSVSKYNLFGGGFAFSDVNSLPVSVEAGDNSEFYLLNKDKLINPCENCCVKHTEILKNMIKILAKRSSGLIERIKIISMRTTRQKVMALLTSYAIKSKSKKFDIPYDRQGMADFLCVDRASLSRELANLKEDEIIDYNKNHFVILQDTLHEWM